MGDSEDTPKPSKRVIMPVYPPYHTGFTDPPISTPAETPTSKANKAKLKAALDKTLPAPTHVSVFDRMRSSPPSRPTSYGLATTLITLAVSSAAGIPNPLHRTLVILLIAVVIYIIGLVTP